MEPKFSELKFELKDVSEMKNSVWTCELEINEDRYTANYKTPLKLQCLEILPNTVFSITLMKSEKPVGSLQISFATLFSESLQGKLERWFKLKSLDYPKLQIKIFASLNLPEKTIKRLPSFASSSQSKDLTPKCPYLDSMPESQISESLKDLWNTRNPCTNSIKFSLEPDSPGIPSQSPSTETVSIDSLKQLGGLQLKHLVKNLCEEITQLEKISHKLPEIKLELEEKIKARRENEKNKQVELEQLKEGWMRGRLLALELLEKRKTAKVNLMEKQESFRRLEAELDILKAFMADLKKEQLLAEVQKMQFEDCLKNKEELQELLVKSQRNKDEVEGKLKKFEAETKIKRLKTADEIDEIRSENLIIQGKIRGVEEEYKKALSDNQALKSSLNRIRSQVLDTEGMDRKAKEAFSGLCEKEKSRDSLNCKINCFLKELEKETSELHLKHSQLISKKSSLMTQLQNINKSIESNENEILDTQKSIFDNKAQKMENEQICCVRADLDQLSKDLKTVESFYSKTKQTLLPELLTSSQLLSNECKKTLNKTELIDQMIESIDQKEKDLEGLKASMGQVQKRQIFHIPVKGDIVDQALAEFVNKKEVQVKFIRQGGGNYQFGSTKVYIKLENSKLLAKARGEFIGIEEFVDTYMATELLSSSGLSGLVRMKKDKSPDAIGRKVKSVFESLSRSPKKQ